MINNAKEQIIEEELISVIIPVYNVEDYLAQCLDSVINQSYKNVEIILVNDGSTDSSPSIIQNYLDIDNRITVVNKSNGGLSDARNVGIKNATAKLLYFLDSDDLIAQDTLKILYREYRNLNSEIVECDFMPFYDNSEFDSLVKKSEEEKATYNLTEFEQKHAIRELIDTSGLLRVNTWNKLYKKSLFIDNGIEFPLGKINEDSFTTYKLILKSKKINYVTYTGVYYRQRAGSIMNSPFNARRLDMIQAAKNMVNDVLLVYPDLINLLYYNVFISQITYLNLLAVSINSDEYESKFYQVRAEMREQIVDISDDLFRTIDKINIFSVNRGLRFHKFFRNLVNKFKNYTDYTAR